MNANKTLNHFALATVATLTILSAAVIIANLAGANGLSALARGAQLPRTPGFLGLATIGAAAGALLFMCSEHLGAHDELDADEY